ncbi:MAG: DUF559 domain-containing protein, partial [Ginsengibacter sp.]
RDAGFSRQRYWGEPFPIIYKDGIAYAVDEKELPVELPHVENYKPGPEGEGPLANIFEWVNLTPVLSPKERDGEDSEGDSGEDSEEDSGGESREENRDDKKQTTWDYMTTDAETWKALKPFARENRKGQTEAEEVLWQNIRNRKISNCKFRRQHAIGGFIVDFVCIERKLVIEIDGEYHDEEEQKKYDTKRTEFLTEQGFTEIRFTNDEVIQNLPGIISAIQKNLMQNTPLLWRGDKGEVKRETNTMPGYAGSSWYFLRYMDPHNDKEFADKNATDYWNQVDVYVGGTEHAVGHLLYSRMWTKVLFDLDHISFDEPYKKLVNQGMIQGSSRFIYHVTFVKKEVLKGSKNEAHNNPIFFSNRWFKAFQDKEIKGSDLLKMAINSPELKKFKSEELQWLMVYPMHVNVELVDGVELNIEEFRNSRPDYANAVFILEDGKVLSLGEDLGEVNSKYICGVETEKMSKSKYNTIDPNDLINKYGADTFRMYEMFLGPVEQSKPWDTKGIEGIHRFLKKLWRLFYDEIKGPIWTSSAPSPLERAGGEVTDAELKVLHKTIKKIEEDTERFAFNTAVSTFMICVNELTDLKCHKKEILEPLLILITPYAPHIAEELYQSLQSPSPPGERPGEGVSVLDASFPKLESKYLIESEKDYPVSINARMRTSIKISLSASPEEVEKIVLQNDVVQKWMEGKPLKKLIYVKNKMINVLV